MCAGAYNEEMAGWSFGIGKIFGVEIRLHSFFVFLVAPAMVWAGMLGRSSSRGVVLWGLLVLAVLVRESARAIAGGMYRLEVRSLLLLPTGGLMVYASAEAEKRAGERRIQRGMALVGPLANVIFGLMVAGFVKTISPEVSLLGTPWITPAHLLQAMVWMNLMLAALNFLPAWPLDAGRVARSEMARGSGSPFVQRQLQVVVRLGFWIALAMISYGMLSFNWWVLMAGLGVLLGSQVERQNLIPDGHADATRVGDVMLTDYTLMPASATLEDAMMEARHSLQDVFPVVRAGNMVGAVGRQNILDALASSGNGYVQGIMTRSFRTASPGDSLMETLNKAIDIGPGASLQIVPVVEGETVVGILTPQHLQRSLSLVPRRMIKTGRAQAEDETD